MAVRNFRSMLLSQTAYISTTLTIMCLLTCSEPHSYLGLLCWCRDFLDVMKAKRVNDLTLWLYIYKDEGLTAPVIIMALIAMATNLPESCIGCRLGVSFAYNDANHYIGALLRKHDVDVSIDYSQTSSILAKSCNTARQTSSA